MILDGQSLTFESIHAEIINPSQLSITDEAIDLVKRSRAVVKHILDRGETVYGVNTGFGKLANKSISRDKLKQLQVNLLRSHAAGTGPFLATRTVRMILLLKINSLLRGYSGIRLQTIYKLIELYNKDLMPAVRAEGSVGASGDLAPLADLALPLIGEGAFIDDQGQVTPAQEVLEKNAIDPLELMEKEGLSLINGTQLSTAMAFESLMRIKDLFYTISATGAFTTEVMLGTDTAFRPEIQEARNQIGQKVAGGILHQLMAGSGYREAHLNCDRVQDFYSIRCMPQVHGSLYDLIIQAEAILVREANSTTDNPVTLIDEDMIVSGGNFHAAPIAHMLDYLAIAVTDVASMSERRIAAFQETSQSNLPMFLMQEAGLNSGFMIAHVTAAALASENKGLSHPASVDSIPTSANQEDHVSMAPNAGRKLRQVIHNATRILAIELMCAAQARDLNPKYSLSQASEEIYQLIRMDVPYLTQDGVLSGYIEHIANLVKHEEIAKICQRHIEDLV